MAERERYLPSSSRTQQHQHKHGRRSPQTYELSPMSMSPSLFSLGLREYRFHVNQEQHTQHTQYYKISSPLRPRHHAVLNPGEYVSLFILRSPKTTESSPREAICGSLGAPFSFRNVARDAISIRSSSSVTFLRPNLSETRNRCRHRHAWQSTLGRPITSPRHRTSKLCLITHLPS